MHSYGNIYIASDLHLGAPDAASSRERERKFVRWLEVVAPNAGEILLLGDFFDFWFEYRHVVPRGYVRVLGKLADLSDAGIRLTFFAGNHDMWFRDYMQQELGARVIMHQQVREFFGRKYFLHHGDGLGPGDHGYKLLKACMRNRFLRWCFARLHPNFGVGLAQYFSRSSRKANLHLDDVDHGEKEFLYQYVKEELASAPVTYDYYVFGHRHLARWHEFSPAGTLIVLGDWIKAFSYLEISAENGPRLRTFRNERPEPDEAVITHLRAARSSATAAQLAAAGSLRPKQ